MAEANEETHEIREHVLDATSTRPQLVLLAEDEEPLRRLMARILESAGYEVIQTADGEEALAAFLEHETRIGVVLMDIAMPGMRGTEVRERIIAVSPNFPIILMTGYSFEIGDLKGGNERNRILLHKPFQLSELLDAITRVMDSAEPG